MKVTVKRWMADQKREEMHKYHLDACFEYVDGYYADVKNDTVTFIAYEVLKESEKAIQVSLECTTRVEMRGHDPYKAWFPKSQIIKIEN